MKAAFTVQLNEFGRFSPQLYALHRSDPQALHVASESDNSYRDFAVSGFDGENEISLFGTGMQDGSIDVVMLHAQVDNPLRVFHKRYHDPKRIGPASLSTDAMIDDINKQIAEWWPA